MNPEPTELQAAIATLRELTGGLPKPWDDQAHAAIEVVCAALVEAGRTPNQEAASDPQR